MKGYLLPYCAASCALVLVACAETQINEAPVIDRSSRNLPSVITVGPNAPTAGAGNPAVAGPPPGAATGAPDRDAQGIVTVRPGDTLFHFAKSLGVELRDLRAWNGLGENSTIAPGQKLRTSPPAEGANSAGRSRAQGAGDAPFAAVSPIPADPAMQTHELAPAPLPAASAPAAPVTSAPAPASGEGWTWPVRGRVVGRFDGKGNKGIEISIEENAPVVAVADGEVSYKGSPKEFGNLVIVRHADDLLSVYAFTKEVLVVQGQKVARGERIALAGSAPGRGPLLHFEVRRKGVAVDPLEMLPSR